MQEFDEFYDRFEKFLKINGQKSSYHRKCLLNIFFHSQKMLTSVELKNQVIEKFNLCVSQNTIYSFANFLNKFGFITIYKENSKLFYEFKEKSHKDYLICKKCGKNTPFCDEKLEELKAKICKKFEFLHLDHYTILYGICTDCKENLVKNQIQFSKPNLEKKSTI